MQQSCSECSRLQHELTEANSALLRIVDEMQRAVMQKDAAALSQAKASLDQATERCVAARVAFEEHGRTHK